MVLRRALLFSARVAAVIFATLAAGCARDAPRDADRQEVREPGPTLRVESIGFSQRGTNAHGEPLRPAYYFRLTGVTTSELHRLFSAATPENYVDHPDGQVGLAEDDLLSFRPSLRVPTGAHELRVRLPDGRTAIAIFEIPLMQFVFSREHTNAEQLAVKDGIAIGQRFAERELGARLTRPIVVWVRDERDPLFCAQAQEQRIDVWAGSPACSALPPPMRRYLMAHEYFHLLQGELSADPMQPPGPIWLVEGSAEVFAYRAVTSAGFGRYERARNCFIAGTLAAGTPPLERLSSGRDFHSALDATYLVGALAVDRLVDRSGLRSLATFFRDATHGDWESAFTRAFGRDPATFYAEFAAYRATLAPPPPAPCL